MADPNARAEARGRPTLAPPRTRGRLVIADQVVISVAQLAAQEVPGTVSDHGKRRGLPRAKARVAGDRARIDVAINVEWPFALTQVTTCVRHLVTDRVLQLTGLHVDAVDVTVVEVIPPTEAEPVRGLG